MQHETSGANGSKDKQNIIVPRKPQCTPQNGSKNVKTCNLTTLNNTHPNKTNKKRGQTHVLRQGKQFMLLVWHPLLLLQTR